MSTFMKKEKQTAEYIRQQLEFINKSLVLIDQLKEDEDKTSDYGRSVLRNEVIELEIGVKRAFKVIIDETQEMFEETCR